MYSSGGNCNPPLLSSVYQSIISDVGLPGQRGKGFFSPDMARGVAGGPPSNGPPMPDCGKKCNQCECAPLQTSHVRKHVKADQIALHSSQLPD